MPQRRSGARMPVRAGGLGVSWTRAASSRDERGPTPRNLAWAVPLRTGPGRDDGWDRRNDASREPDRGRANQVVLLLRRRSTLRAASVVALYTSHSSPRELKARLGKHSCQRCHRAHAQLRLKTPGSCVTAELRFSAAERPSALNSALTAPQSSRKQRPAPRAAPPTPKPKQARRP